MPSSDPLEYECLHGRKRDPPSESLHDVSQRRRVGNKGVQVGSLLSIENFGQLGVEDSLAGVELPAAAPPLRHPRRRHPQTHRQRTFAVPAPASPGDEGECTGLRHYHLQRLDVRQQAEDATLFLAGHRSQRPLADLQRQPRLTRVPQVLDVVVPENGVATVQQERSVKGILRRVTTISPTYAQLHPPHDQPLPQQSQGPPSTRGRRRVH